jgi:hypothetical protein
VASATVQVRLSTFSVQFPLRLSWQCSAISIQSLAMLFQGRTSSSALGQILVSYYSAKPNCVMRIDIESSYFPRLTRWHISRALKWFSERDLEGLHSIRVIDECPDDPESGKVSRYLRGFLYNGHYSRKLKHQPAEVVLYARDVYFGIPRLLMATSVARLRMTSKLAHEVGHHVIATRGYVYKPGEKYEPWDGTRNPDEEKMADSYASDVIELMLRRGRYKLGKLIARMLSTFFYKAGIQEYWDGNYKSSARLQSRAYTLNPENEDAGQCYRHAMEKLKTQNPSPLTVLETEWLTQRYNSAPSSSSRKLRLTKKNGSSSRRTRAT